MLSSKFNQKSNKRIVLTTLLSLILVIVFGFFYLYFDGKKNVSTYPVLDIPELDNSNLNSNALSQSYKLNIETLGIKAPIVLNVEGNNKKAYLVALENGVAHMARTALPGEAGNSVIFGHSSYYKSEPGNYKTIFEHLDELKIGGEVEVINEAKNLSYIVIENKIVAPDDVSVVHQDKEKYFLTLITCWPPGTIDKRRVIIAEKRN